MKTTTKQPKGSQATEPKVNNQASASNILQTYKDKTVQHQSEEELLQGKFKTVQLKTTSKGQKILDDAKKLRDHLARHLDIKDKSHSIHGKNYNPQGDSPESILDNLLKPVHESLYDDKLNKGREEITQLKAKDTESIQGKFETLQLTTEQEVESLQRIPNNTGLPDNLKSGIENLAGYSMNDVKVHYNSSQPATLQAHAYAQGTDIHIAPGQEKHLPHEAWHVVQQKQGRVKPTMQMKGNVNVNDDAGLEKEADVMGGKALQQRSLNRKQLENGSNETQQNITSTISIHDVKQMVSFLNVKRIANNGSMYMGKNTAGPPNLAHGGGTNWYGSKATAAEYGQPPGGIWQIQANRALNLVDIGTADSVKWIMEETIRRRGIQGLNGDLINVLGNFDFAYAIPNAVANVADNYLQYAISRFQGAARWPGDSYGVTQVQMDGAVQLAQSVQEIPLWAGSVIQIFAGQNGGNAIQLNEAAFLADPNAYRIIRKDATALDAGFANALLDNLNDPNLFHGLHVPLGMKFGGWTGTKLEILIKNSPQNLTVQGQVVANGNEPDINVTDKMIGVDNSWLAWAWRLLGLNS